MNLRGSAPEPKGTDHIAALKTEIQALEEAITSQQIKLKQRFDEIQYFEQALLSIQNYQMLKIPQLHLSPRSSN